MKKVLLVTNSFAGSVSKRAHEVIVKALSADFKLESESTRSRDHATELGREAAERGFDAVVAFGGDGTINEVAQALVGTEVALGVLPGGSTNVVVRSLGIPIDPIDATAFVASHLRSRTQRRINVGRIGSRYFLFCAGMGLDAEVVKRVENDPRRRKLSHNYLFVRHALDAAATRYRAADAGVTLEVDGHSPREVLFVVCCNARPFTYFRSRPVDACPLAQLDLGLDFLGLTKIHASTIPRVIWSLFVSRSHPGWKNAVYHHDVEGATVSTAEPLPVQVDGDYIGEMTTARLDLIPKALTLLV